MINHSDYPKYLPDHDRYQSDPSIKKPLFASFKFYLDLFKIVKYANNQAKLNIYNRYNWVASSLDVLRIVEKAGIKVSVTGMKNLSLFEGPCVIIGNHMSTLETLLLPSMIQPVKSVLYVIKKELISFPLFGPVASARYPIVVGRSNPREDLKIVMSEGAKSLKNGKSIIIFPQKTRSAIFDPSQFNSLGVKLAKKNDVPVVPLALITDAWGNGKIVKEIGKIDASKQVHFAFGEPMKVVGSGAEEHENVIKFILDKFTEWVRKDLIKN